MSKLTNVFHGSSCLMSDFHINLPARYCGLKQQTSVDSVKSYCLVVQGFQVVYHEACHAQTVCCEVSLYESSGGSWRGDWAPTKQGPEPGCF